MYKLGVPSYIYLCSCNCKYSSYCQTKK